MKKIIIVSIVLILASLTSCNKDQRAIKKLDGTWNAKSYTISDDGVSYDYIQQGLDLKMTFDDCKLKNDEWCNLTQTLTSQGETEIETALYKVQGDGSEMVWKNGESSNTTTTLTIKELSKSDLTLTLTDNDATFTLVFEKE